MGQSTDGQLCYGVIIDEEEVPWTEDYDEWEDWWLETQGYEEPFEWSVGTSEAYFEHKRNFLKAHPCPVEVVYHCSCDYTMYLLAVPGTLTIAFRGNPEIVDPVSPNSSKVQELLDFCKKYNIEHDKPGWILSSMWC